RTLLARWLRVARRGVAHGQCDVPRREVFAGADTEAGLALVEEITGGLALLGLHRHVAVVAPAVALPGVQRHTIARADLTQALHLHDASVAVRRDDARMSRLVGNRQHLGVGRNQPLRLLVCDGVENHEATDEAELTHVLDAQWAHAHDAAAGAVLVGV